MVIDRTTSVVKASPVSRHARHEIAILQRALHPNVVRMLEWRRQGEWYFVTLEHAGRTLATCVARETPPTPYETIRILGHVATGLQYLHTVMHVAHRDLKPDNIMIEGSDRVRLIDFNLSYQYRRHEREFSLRGVYGSLAYAAPEMVRGRLYSGYCADMWSYGILAIELFTRRCPFRVASNIDPAFRVFLVESNSRASRCYAEMHHVARACVDACLVVDARKRKTASYLTTLCSRGGRRSSDVIPHGDDALCV